MVGLQSHSHCTVDRSLLSLHSMHDASRRGVLWFFCPLLGPLSHRLIDLCSRCTVRMLIITGSSTPQVVPSKPLLWIGHQPCMSPRRGACIAPLAGTIGSLLAICLLPFRALDGTCICGFPSTAFPLLINKQRKQPHTSHYSLHR